MFPYFSSIINGVHVLWLDNYSKNYKQNIYTVRNEVGYKECQWSAEGISPYTKQNIVRVNLNLPVGEVLCGCPSVDEYDHWFEVVKKHFFFWVDGSSSANLFDSVDVNKLKISSVPISFTKSLKALKSEIGDEELAKTAFNDQFEKVTLMDSFYSYRLLRNNIGKNVGVVRWLSKLQHRMLHGEYKNKYVVLKADCNIFLRVLAVSEVIFFSFLI